MCLAVWRYDTLACLTLEQERSLVLTLMHGAVFSFFVMEWLDQKRDRMSLRFFSVSTETTGFLPLFVSAFVLPCCSAESLNGHHLHLSRLLSSSLLNLLIELIKMACFHECLANVARPNLLSCPYRTKDCCRLPRCDIISLVNCPSHFDTPHKYTRSAITTSVSPV